MGTSVQTFIEMCQWDTAKFLIISGNVFAPLIYYSHLFALIPSLLIGLIIFLRDRKSLINQILFFITTTFSLWVFADLVLWASEKPDLIMFFWSLQVIIEPIMYAACVYFIYVFITKKDISLKKKIGIAVFLVPTLLFASTKYALTGFDLTNCNRETAEGPLTLYGYGVEIIYTLWILSFVIRKFWKATKEERRQIILITTGIILFLLFLASGNIIGSFTEDWTLGQYGLFGMPIFISFLAYMIVKFKAFNVKLIGAQALVLALGFLVLAILFIRKIEDARIIVIFTLLLIVALGYALVKSVKKEIQQREQLAELLQQRESLTHLVTHKVKGYFTRTKCVFAEMVEGSFGILPPKAKEMAAAGLASDNEGIAMVDMVLNQASLQAGLVKYDMKPFDFKKMVEEVIEDKRLAAEKKGLKIEIEAKDEDYTITGDRRWLKEAAFSYVDNAVKYTDKGKIIVGFKLKEKQLLYYVKDTGGGITDEDKKILWTEGGKGKNSLLKNPDSTGYGLSGTRKIVEGHKGKYWVDSEVGKGSIFYMELPLTQK